MNNLTSVFELYVAVNGAYIISQDFTVFLNNRVLNSFASARVKLLQLEEILTGNKLSLENLIDQYKNQRAREEIKSLLESQNRIEREGFEKIEAIRNKIEVQGTSGGFNYYCFYASIYSFIILLLIGFNVNHVTEENCLCFTILNILSIIFFFLAIRKRRSWKIKHGNKKQYQRYLGSGYISALWIIGISIFFFLLLHGIGALKPSHSFKCQWDVLDMIMADRIVSVIIPGAHFIYYFGS